MLFALTIRVNAQNVRPYLKKSDMEKVRNEEVGKNVKSSQQFVDDCGCKKSFH